jgi:hypothetical protein
MFGQRQRLRTLASHMLLVWVLALLSTVVNACVVPPAAQATAGAVAHDCHEAAVPQGTEAPATKSVCAKFCDEDASSAPSLQRLACGATDVCCLGPALWPTLALAAQAALEPQHGAAVGQGHLPAPVPVSIAFLRLTL